MMGVKTIYLFVYRYVIRTYTGIPIIYRNDNIEICNEKMGYSFL